MDLYTIKVGPKTVADRLSLDKAKQLLPKYGPNAQLIGPWSSGPQPLKQRFKKESSVAGNIKGFQSPIGLRIFRRKKMTNPSKPYDESKNFENLVTLSALNNQDISEVVQKIGNRWVVVDDKTGARRGSYDSREKAWEKQRMLRKQAKQERKSHSAKKFKAKKAHTAPKPHTAPHAKKAPKPRVSKEQILRQVKDVFASVLKEASMISYVFQQPSISEESMMWERFISRLSQETVMSDPKLKLVLNSIAKTEAKVLGSAVNSIAGLLGETGAFSVDKKGVDQDENGDVVMSFDVNMNESGKRLPFAVKLENGRPLILFPEETRRTLNSMGTDESKLLRAETMHIQETVLDNMHDVVEATKNRDNYLKNMQEKITKTVDSMGPLEVALLKYLLKGQNRGAR
ncbi:MAG: hypothetical protein UT24_C0036G0004 [Candidatus Woesebacteria bacterium GW2011_GWB1_39_12]|uniref:Uncharacterized protein n=1 Tax=Candidatus Woesebacteria bacterium GW2011_GWB1_39_12 TaxID=1618574 RepID=A0A0G0QAU1_9BACT|nr:MAG: hypothetical protein UT24_C0036G0004 [Candidatus Woesebacteria bacterium GW2011_GWB1_39_12]